jgi:SAM-dependent methyltransferase
MNLRHILSPLFYSSDRTRSALKALLPVRCHDSIRRWFHPGAGVQWCRIVMNQELSRFIRSLDCPNIDALEISGSGSQERFKFRSYRATQYPDYDVCSGPLAREQFDLIIAEQVFEHVLRPDHATASVYQMLRPGGIFVISTPFLLKVHGAPSDLYRWTEYGMRQLLENGGFRVIATASWGNRQCLLADLKPGLEWTIFNPRRHSLHNEPQFPIVVWAFAEKRKSE